LRVGAVQPGEMLRQLSGDGDVCLNGGNRAGSGRAALAPVSGMVRKRMGSGRLENSSATLLRFTPVQYLFSIFAFEVNRWGVYGHLEKYDQPLR
jgi:hypothetical protein